MNGSSGSAGFTTISKQYTLPTMYKAIDEGVDMLQLEILANNKDRLNYFIDSVGKYISDTKHNPIAYIFEFKTESNKTTSVDVAMSVVNEKHMEATVVMAAFDIAVLKYVHQKYPGIKTALICKADSKSSFRKQLNDLGFDPSIYYAEYPLVNDALVKDCKSRKIRLMTWIVNDKEEIKKLRRMGVSGINSDTPNLFSE
jgi:glycerophosphoryl diester phosphodiesterase